jgi:hypothetical protein
MAGDYGHFAQYLALSGERILRAITHRTWNPRDRLGMWRAGQLSVMAARTANSIEQARVRHRGKLEHRLCRR